MPDLAPWPVALPALAPGAAVRGAGLAAAGLVAAGFAAGLVVGLGLEANSLQ